MTLYYITCRDSLVFASTDYDAVFERRANIDAENLCRDEDVHPIRSRSITRWR